MGARALSDDDDELARLWQGRVACDDAVIAEVCVRHGHPGTLVPGDNILPAT